ncbi:MAG: trypsin-like serine protease [Cyanobacteria bacterium]|nr:trypsin-like serine protease [Cyanobacteria bacterium CG_2015-16_32_12]NCO78780.1 trypsin-like serine protease [Cyanobacteria bacterium CG_2015-22_32_23]NCQ05275.1 trypsin-like serine protease [Cyanobacteria bacterium CG_2015-09_32_10]NCQ42094.1 trypsin-like serine protease [Cyanobacteria bacterium CG_2015-04_32_10]NCS86087.1 trypsin-like serine protease [Cyanobacteria bacterium CG_2015-02_32_10]
MNIRQFINLFSALCMGVIIAFSGSGINSLTAQAQIPVNITTESFVALAVEKTGDSVVRIDTEKVITRSIEPMFEDPFFRQFFGDGFRNSMTQERKVTGLGSGFIVDSRGIILTNAHVVSDADKVTVTLKDGRIFEGEVKGTDVITDLAVIKVNSQGQNLPVATLGDSSQVKVGDWAIAVGNPVGLDNTVTLGIISTLHRSSSEVGIFDKRIDFLQTDAAINPGNSGGPLLNAQGEVIGINTAIRADAMGIGFAIPINKVKQLQTILAEGKEVPHPSIGIQMVKVTPELARENNRDANATFLIPEVEGVLVVRVLPETPAEKGGIRRADVILKVNNQIIKDANQLQQLVENSGINQSLKFSILRGEQKLDLNITTAQLR